MSDDTTRRRFLTIAGSGAAAALAGCAGNEPDESSEATDEPTASDGSDEMDGSDGGDGGDGETSTDAAEFASNDGPEGTLRLAAPGPVQTLDPINAKGSGAGWPQYSEMLTTFEDGRLPPVASLAEDFTVSDDGRTYTFQLKEGVQFHDGSELTAQDFVYSWERLAQSENSRNKDDIVGATFTIEHEGNTDDSLDNYEAGTLATEAVDDYTFRFTLATPFQGSLSQIAGGAFAVIPEGAVGDIEGYDGEYDYNEYFSTSGDGPQLATTGPFQIGAWTKGDALTLEAFPDYHGEGPALDEITYTVIGSSDTRYRRFENGNLDVLEGLPGSQYQPENLTLTEENGNRRLGRYELGDGDVVRYGEATVLDTRYLVFNTNRVERPVRQAIAYLVNQEAIAEDIYKGLAEPAYHITPPAVFPAEDGETPADVYDRHASEGFRAQTEFGADGFPYSPGESDVQSAQEVMEAAGYGEDDRYELSFYIDSGSTEREQLASRLRDLSSAAYIDMTIQQADFGTIISNAINGTMDMFALVDGMEWPESDNFLRFLWGGDPETQFTRWGAEGSNYDQEFYETAQSAWEENYIGQTGPTEAEQASRDEAYLTVEEMNWASVQELPTVHPVANRLWYDNVDIQMFDAMEDQTFDDVEIDR